MKLERQTYANCYKMKSNEYERVHGIIEAFGGRVKDCKYNWDKDEMVIFYEMSKSQRAEFEKELGI